MIILILSVYIILWNIQILAFIIWGIDELLKID